MAITIKLRGVIIPASCIRCGLILTSPHTARTGSITAGKVYGQSESAGFGTKHPDASLGPTARVGTEWTHTVSERHYYRTITGKLCDDCASEPSVKLKLAWADGHHLPDRDYE